VAITIEQSPQDYTPVYGDIIYVVSSNNYANTNFKFVAVVKSGSTTLAKLKAPILYGTTDKGVFNISQILRNYVTYDYTNTLTAVAKCSNSYVSYSVEFGEEYGTTPAEYLALTTSSGKWAWNGVIPYISVNSPLDYVCTSDSAKFLTRVRQRRVSMLQRDYLYFIAGATTDVAVIEVKAYNAAGTLLADSDISQPFDGNPADEYMLRVAAGPLNLNSIVQAQLISGTEGNLIPASTAYYTMQLHDNAAPPPTYLSELYRFDVVEECSKYDTHYLYFLNPLGGFESVRFSYASKDIYSVERKQFKRNNYTYDGSSYFLDPTKHAMTNYHIEKKQQVVLNTGALNDTEWEWLQDLIASPVVFYDGNNPVNIVDTKYEVSPQFEPNSLTVTIEFTEPEYSQTV
jgi:hypothetical protein